MHIKIGRFAFGFNKVVFDSFPGWKVRSIKTRWFTVFLCVRPKYKKPLFVDPLHEFWNGPPNSMQQGVIRSDDLFR